MISLFIEMLMFLLIAVGYLLSGVSLDLSQYAQDFGKNIASKLINVFI